MSALYLLAVIAIIIFVWVARGKYEARKTEEFKDSQKKKLESAKKALDQLRELRKKTSLTYAELRSIDSDDWNSLSLLRRGFHGEKLLESIGTSSEDVSELIHEYSLKGEWYDFMRRIADNDYSQSMFDYYLEERAKFLMKNGKTLSDFGAAHDDIIGLTAEFHTRLIAHAKEEVNRLKFKVRKYISEFKAENPTLQIKFEDD
ncbi:MAG: hypothetical protein WCF92_01265 [bacterium]